MTRKLGLNTTLLAVTAPVVILGALGLGGWYIDSFDRMPTASDPQVACIVGPTEILEYTNSDGSVLKTVQRVTVGCDGSYFTSRAAGGRFGLAQHDWDSLRQGHLVTATYVHKPGGVFTRPRDFLVQGDIWTTPTEETEVVELTEDIWDVPLPMPRPAVQDDSPG